MIVGRGGGSIEDLWPFNEEIVARAIYDCKTPVISAVGHEIDFTIADFVADLRAPTPTGAAEMAVPQYSDIINYLGQLNIRANSAINNKIKNYRQKLNSIQNRNIFKNPMVIYQAKEMVFDALFERLKFSIKNIFNDREKRLLTIKNSYVLKNPYQLLDKKANKYLQIVSKLETLSPIKTLQRGYTFTKKDGKVVTSSKNVKKDDILDIEFTDGMVKTKVI